MALNIKRKHYIIIAIVALFVLTNPSPSSFASFKHESYSKIDYNDERRRSSSSSLGRDFNGLVFSLYSSEYYSDQEGSKTILVF